MLIELNYREAADYCGLKESTFRKLCKEGKGPKARLEGRSVRFLKEHLGQWLEEYKQEAYSTNTATLNSKRAKGRKKATTTAATAAASSMADVGLLE